MKIFFPLTFLLCSTLAAHSQIVYTDVNPDSTVFTSFDLDLNKDGTDDFTVFITSGRCGDYGTKHWCKITPLNGNMTLTHAFSESDTINSTLLWSSQASQALAWSGFGIGCGSGGPWYSAGKKYMALKVVSGLDNFYGWMQLEIILASGFTVYDYAINSNPGQSILAGQTCPPQAAIIANGPTTFCEGDSVILSSANSGTDLSYKWKLNGVNISGATDKSYTAKVAGKYKVRVTVNTNGCTTTSASVKVKVPCRIEDESMKEKSETTLTTYPNPFSGATTITFSLSNSENVSLLIFDVQGRLIRTLADEPVSEGEHTISWNATDTNGNEVADGIYFLRIETESEVETIKISVVK